MPNFAVPVAIITKGVRLVAELSMRADVFLGCSSEEHTVTKIILNQTFEKHMDIHGIMLTTQWIYSKYYTY